MNGDDERNYPTLCRFLRDNMPKVRSKGIIWRAFLKYSELKEADAIDAMRWGTKPKLVVANLGAAVNGRFNGKLDANKVELASDIADYFEKTQIDGLKRLVESTVLHEMVHWGDHKDGKDQDPEEGKEFEKEAYGRDIGRFW